MNPDKIERTIEIAAPITRVWHALTDHRKFGSWFRVELEGPFTLGQIVRGKMTYPGFEGEPFEAKVEVMEPDRRFSFSWPPYLEDTSIDLSQEPWTVVTFVLETTAHGTRLTVTETGFSRLSDRVGPEAYRNNTEGWKVQVENIAAYVTTPASE
jgi:uncharacterized protein YndB with AHSA1/START domain